MKPTDSASIPPRISLILGHECPVPVNTRQAAAQEMFQTHLSVVVQSLKNLPGDLNWRFFQTDHTNMKY